MLIRINDVGIIGLGRMGLLMARHFLAANFSVRDFGISSAAAEGARPAGVMIMEPSARTAAQSDAVNILAGFDSQIVQAVFGMDRVFTGAGPGCSPC